MPGILDGHLEPKIEPAPLQTGFNDRLDRRDLLSIV